MYVGDDSTAKTTTKKHFLVLMKRNIGKFRGRGSFFFSRCAHELNLSFLYVGDDSVAKQTSKKHFLVLMKRNIGKFRGPGSFKIWPR